jgi:hypothetical protein
LQWSLRSIEPGEFKMTFALETLSRLRWWMVFVLGACLACTPAEPEKLAKAPPLAGQFEVQGGSAAQPNPSAEQASEATPAAPAAPPVTEVPQLLTEAELQEGWIALFDGKTLFGWEAATDANWRVEEGAIVVDQGTPGLLCTKSEFTDYVLQLEYRSPVETNSGVFVHTPVNPQDAAVDCYEINIAGSDNPFPTGSLVKRHKAAEVPPDTDWQTMQITVQEGHVQVLVNGNGVLDILPTPTLRRGHIGLQLNTGAIAFRNIRLKPLVLASLFNGKDLTGWKSYPEMASRFTVTPEGWLHVENGRGQLETEQSYGDFLLQLECQTHAPELNSGVFYRCIPGQTMNGYEVQIHNGIRDSDRSRPVDCGTGGIFRRQNARLVVADDQKFFHMTIVATGAHVSTWVNGYPVADWTDERPAHENPRQGLRVEPGTIMLQGHDPTTQISFRNLRIASY